MIRMVRAVYEAEGRLRLLQPVELVVGQEVELDIALPSAEEDSAFDLASLAVDGGPRDLASEHDHYLYGKPRQVEPDGLHLHLGVWGPGHL